ncbi:hypothetical protein [uncultured Tateyamaria sp.]|uniref:hypothetical protein n=1 Tax=uncultured Tateyamaria sp. TaxID=455651 RepID=UPI0026294BDD|nr:hypothetical protein [uncultured Tateyamaria sp.]
MTKVQEFFQECVDELRPHGWFAASTFDTIEGVMKAYRADILYGEEFEAIDDLFEDMRSYYFAGLLALDRKCCAHFNMKKAGAEGGEGYYQGLVQHLVSCFADDVVAVEDWTLAEQGFANIVPVHVSATLRSEWVADGDDAKRVEIDQSFAPMRSWSDYEFVAQLVQRLLGDKRHQMLSRPGIDDEWVLFIFPPNKAAADALMRLEKKLFRKNERSEFWTHPVQDLPQPTEANINDIMRTAGHDVELVEDGFGGQTVQVKSKQFLGIPLRVWMIFVLLLIVVIINIERIAQLFGIPISV